jgi:hypothetical protein
MAARQIGDGTIIDAGFDVDPRDQQLEALRAENRRLQRAVSDAELAAGRAREDADRALSNLRRQLNPLYRALQMVFGELDAAGVTDTAAPSTAPATAPTAPATDPRWESWKQKLPGRAAEIIDLLLLHGEMSRNQLMAAMHVGKDVVRVTMSRLNVAGLINKNGGKFSLKPLS